jgi:hypothetical protein
MYRLIFHLDRLFKYRVASFLSTFLQPPSLAALQPRNLATSSTLALSCSTWLNWVFINIHILDQITKLTLYRCFASEEVEGVEDTHEVQEGLSNSSIARNPLRSSFEPSRGRNSSYDNSLYRWTKSLPRSTNSPYRSTDPLVCCAIHRTDSQNYSAGVALDDLRRMR